MAPLSEINDELLVVVGLSDEGLDRVEELLMREHHFLVELVDLVIRRRFDLLADNDRRVAGHDNWLPVGDRKSEAAVEEHQGDFEAARQILANAERINNWRERVAVPEPMH